jgi:ElaB/YqjD/DUF883 family membrane-anchored ribosome-binding protein
MADNMAEGGTRMGEHLQDETAGVTDKAREAVGRYARQAKDYAQQGYDVASEKGKQIRDTTQHYIEENPWYAIGIALGVGVLVGLVLRGSSRD